MIKAKEGCCEETAMGLPAGMVLPCNEPAEFLVSWPRRSEGPYRMCAACADHSVRNRGAVKEEIGARQCPTT